MNTKQLVANNEYSCLLFSFSTPFYLLYTSPTDIMDIPNHYDGDPLLIFVDTCWHLAILVTR